MIITIDYDVDSASDKKYRATARTETETFIMKFDHFPTIDEIQSEIDFTIARRQAFEPAGG